MDGSLFNDDELRDILTSDYQYAKSEILRLQEDKLTLIKLCEKHGVDLPQNMKFPF